MNDTTCIWPPHWGQHQVSTSYTRLINMAHAGLLPVAGATEDASSLDDSAEPCAFAFFRMPNRSCSRGDGDRIRRPGFASGEGHVLDLFDFVRFQTEIEHFQILTHVGHAARAGQGNHAHVNGKPKDKLRNAASMIGGNCASLGDVHAIRLAVSNENA